MPAQNLLEFIIYVAPGFLVLEIYYSRYPRRKKSDFSKITWSVIYGVFIYAIVSWVDSNYFNDYLQPNLDIFPNFILIIALFIVAILFSSFLIKLRKLRHFMTKNNPKRKILGFPLYPNFQSIWEEINHGSNKNWAIVFLSDGSVYRGWIKQYNLDPEAASQDFLLADVSRVDEQLNEIYKVNGMGLYLNTKDVIRIEFLKGAKK